MGGNSNQEPFFIQEIEAQLLDLVTDLKEDGVIQSSDRLKTSKDNKVLSGLVHEVSQLQLNPSSSFTDVQKASVSPLLIDIQKEIKRFLDE